MITIVDDDEGIVCYGRNDRHMVCAWGDNYFAMYKLYEYCNPVLPLFRLVTDRGMISASNDLLQAVKHQILIGNIVYEYKPKESLTPVRLVPEWHRDQTQPIHTEHIAVGKTIIVDKYIAIECDRLETVTIDGYRCCVIPKEKAKIFNFTTSVLSLKPIGKARLLPR